MENSVPSNVNITSTINSATANIKEQGDLVFASAKAIVNVVNKISAIETKDFKKNIDKINLITGNIKEYITIISDLFKSLFEDNGAFKTAGNIKEMLGFIDEVYEDVKDENGKIQKKKIRDSRFLLIDGIISFCDIFDKLTKIITSVINSTDGKTKIVFFAKRKIQNYVDNIRVLIGLAVESIKEIQSEISGNNIKQLLGADNNIKQKIYENSKDEKDTNTSILKDEKEINTKEYGLFDAIERFLNIGNLLSSIQVPSITGAIKASISIKVYAKYMKTILGDIKGVIENMFVDKTGKPTDGKTFSKSVGSLAEAVSSISSIFSEFTTIIETLQEMCFKALILKGFVQKTLNFLWAGYKDKKNSDEKKGIFVQIFDILNSTMFYKMSKEDGLQQTVSGVKSTIDTFAGLIGTMASIGNIKYIFQLIISKLVLKVVGWVFKGLTAFIEVVVDFANKSREHSKLFKEANDLINEVGEIFESIKKISLNIILIGLLSIPAILSMFAVTGFVIMLMLFIPLLNKIVKLVSRQKKDITTGLKNTMVIFGLLAAAAVTLIFVGFITQFIDWNATGKGILGCLGLILLVVGLVWIVSQVLNKANSRELTNTFILIGLIILSLIGVAVTLLIIQLITSQIVWLELFKNLGLMLLVVGAILAIAFVAGSFSVFYIPAIIGLGLFFMVAVMLMTVCLSLLILQSIGSKINEADVIAATTSIFNCVRSIFEEIDNTDFVNVVTLALVTIKFFILTFTIGLIYIIGSLLNALGEETMIDPKTGEIVGSFKHMDNAPKTIDKIFNIVSHIMEKLTAKDESSKDGDKGLLHTLISFISPGLANLVDALLGFSFVLTTLMTVGAIYLIGKVLNSIAKMDLKETDIEDNLKKIIGCAKNISKMINGTYKTESEGDEGGILSKIKGFFKGSIGGMIDVLANIGAAGVLVSLMPSVLMLNTVVELIKNIQELKLDKKDQNDITTKVSEIIHTAKLVSKTVSGDKNSIEFDPKKIDQYEDFVDTSIKYFESINKLDTNKIKSIGDMYEKMGQFMEKLNDAPINDIADALVNKISPALDDINKSMNTNSTNNSTTVTTQAAGQNTQTSKQVDYTSMLENIEDLLEQIKKKLNSQPQPAF